MCVCVCVCAINNLSNRPTKKNRIIVNMKNYMFYIYYIYIYINIVFEIKANEVYFIVDETKIFFFNFPK